MEKKTIALYTVRFRPHGSKVLQMDTVDPDKIGPWIAEMFSLFPYQRGTMPPNGPVLIETSELWYE